MLRKVVRQDDHKFAGHSMGSSCPKNGVKFCKLVDLLVSFISKEKLSMFRDILNVLK